MASKRIDELDARVVADTDLLPVTPSGGPSGKATVAAIVAEGLSQPNSASSGAGASITIKAADGVTSGAGGSIILQPGAQATTGGNGVVKFTSSTNNFVNFNVVGASGVEITSSGYVRILANTLIGNTYAFSFQDATGGLTAVFSPSGAGQLKITGNSYPGQVVSESSTYALSASVNNLILTGGSFQRINCTSASDITGIGPSGNPTTQATIHPNSHTNGRVIRLVSVGTATVTLKHNDAASTAANRMYMHGGNHTALTVNEWADLVYDSTDNGSGAAGWRVVKYA